MAEGTETKTAYSGYGYHGGGRPKGWRKTDGTERTAQLQIRLTAAQKEELKERAQAAGLTVSAYVLKMLFS